MAVIREYHVSEKCRITEKGPEVIREYRLGDDAVAGDAYTFLAGSYTAAGYPVLGEQYAPDVEIYVDEVQAQRTGSDKEFGGSTGRGINSGTLFVWKVTVKYSAPEYTTFEQDDTEIFDVSIFGEGIDMDGRFDFRNEPNQNSVGEFYEDRLPIQAPVIVVRLSVKSSGPPDTTLHRTMNSGAWWGGAAHKWLCRNVSGEYVHSAEERYWKNTYEFAYINHSDLDWTLKKACSGYYHRTTESGIGGSRVRNTNIDGSENVRPVLLNASGGLLNGDGSVDGPQEVYYQHFWIYPEASFPSLPCPLGWVTPATS